MTNDLKRWQAIVLQESEMMPMLYHGTNKAKLSEILDEGIDAPSYWGTLDKARQYADEFSQGVVFGLALSRFNQAALRENENFVEYYRNEGDEVYAEWERSSQTWRDSLELFDSVVYHDILVVGDEDIVE